MKIFEVFDKVVDWKYTHHSQGENIAVFEINQYEYEVVIYEIDILNVYDVVFTQSMSDGETKHITDNSRYKINKSGNALMVFSTVKDILRDFISKATVDAYVFSADEGSRIKLYSRFLEMSQEFGLPATTQKVSNNVHYFIMAKDNKTIQKISEKLYLFS